MSISHRIRTKISEDGDIWPNKTGHRGDIEETVPAEGYRNNRSESVPGPYPYADKHPAQVQCIADNGVFEREEQSDDI